MLKTSQASQMFRAAAVAYVHPLNTTVIGMLRAKIIFGISWFFTESFTKLSGWFSEQCLLH